MRLSHSSVSSVSSLSSSVLLGLALAAGCATSPAAPSDQTGTLQIPLQQPGSDGALYRLDGTFVVTSPGGVQTLDATGAEPSLTVTLPPGLVNVQLSDGWSLTKSVDGGLSFTPVSALLGSPNPNTARILANQPAELDFQFLVRTTTGNLTIGFGVTPTPRELAGGVVADPDPTKATGDYIPYVNARLDFAVFYDLAQVDSVVLADGTKDRTFTAGAVAMEFYNDSLGVLSGSVGPAIAGGFLAYHLAALPDGTQTITGEIDGANDPFTTLTFGPHVLPTNVPVDADGFPTDAFLFDSLVPFAMTTTFDDAGDATLTGQLRFRSIPN